MEKLLHIAKASAEQAEVYFSRCNDDVITINDGTLKTVKSSITSGYALRVIKNGKIGLAYTCNLLDREKLVAQALNSAEAGAKADFSFPKTDKVAELKPYDPSIKTFDKDQLMIEANEVINYIKSKSDAQVNIYIYIGVTQKDIINSTGTNLTECKSWYTFYLWLPFPSSASNVTYTILASKAQSLMNKAEIDRMLELYALNENQIEVKTAKMKVILMPRSVNSFVGRFDAAARPACFENKTSPLVNKLGEQIFSDKLTIYQDPLDDSNTEYSAFDGEGVARQKTLFVEKGVFKNIYTDLNFAAKLNMQQTGNGGRSEIEGPITPSVNCYSVAPGDKSLAEMIAGIDEGIIVYGLMDSYAGNFLAGDYSIGISTGFYIKNGNLIGRVKECMIAGNIYETFNRITAIENEAHFFGYGNFPAIAFDEISVAGAE